MDSALIVSSTEKGTEYFSTLLEEMSIGQIITSMSCSDARRIVSEYDFDLVIINAPLKDESGENFAKSVASKGISQVIIVVANSHFEEITKSCEDDGVLTVAKPVNKEALRGALGLVKSTQKRLMKAIAENEKLKQKIEDIRIIDRAKWILISYMNMDEKEAHRYIEKQAMDMRRSKRIVAEGILKTYEN